MRAVSISCSALKALVAFVGALIGVLGCVAQGTVAFANAGGGVNAPIFYGTTRLGPEWSVELYGGATADSVETLGTVTSFLGGGGAGYFKGGTVVVPMVAPGEEGYFQIRVWQNDGNTITSYASAELREVVRGYSGVCPVVTGGFGEPASSPAALTLTGGIEYIDPEAPRRIVLAVLAEGTISLWFRADTGGVVTVWFSSDPEAGWEQSTQAPGQNPDGSYGWMDPDPVEGTRFYRVMVEPD
jgi:hypothetical protein